MSNEQIKEDSAVKNPISNGKFSIVANPFEFEKKKQKLIHLVAEFDDISKSNILDEDATRAAKPTGAEINAGEREIDAAVDEAIKADRE